MNIVDSSGAKEVHVWEPGHAYWQPAMPPGATHRDVNAGTAPIEVMVVELKNDHWLYSALRVDIQSLIIP